MWFSPAWYFCSLFYRLFLRDIISYCTRGGDNCSRIKYTRALLNLFLLVASIGFYAWGEPRFVFVMLFSIIVNYLFGLWLVNIKTAAFRRAVVFISVSFNLLLLLIFKYLTFSLSTVRTVSGISFPVPEIALPIGISFFTFQAMSYVLDVAYGRAKVQKNPLWVCLYISFFPQLIAGPIVKYETVANEIQNRRENWDDFSQGLCRFAVGLSKKVLLANNMAVIADHAFTVQELSVGMAWLGAFAYTFQIYFDFSGYSDMAIGLGRMFGFHFEENFRYPYIARSITEFWRRWHISLSSWFRDYVYIPLGGSRVSSKRRYWNLFVVWLLTGIWHGANWTFLVWGLYYFVLLAVEKALGLDKRHISLWRVFSTFLLVNFGWVLFRAASLPAAAAYVAAMFGIGADGFWSEAATMFLRDYKVFLAGALLFSTPVAPWASKRKETQGWIGSILYAAGLSALVLLSVCYLFKGSYDPFIYFNF